MERVSILHCGNHLGKVKKKVLGNHEIFNKLQVILVQCMVREEARAGDMREPK